MLHFAILLARLIFDSVHHKPKSVQWSNSFVKRCTGDPVKEDAMLVARSKGDEKYIQNLGQKPLQQLIDMKITLK